METSERYAMKTLPSLTLRYNLPIPLLLELLTCCDALKPEGMYAVRP